MEIEDVKDRESLEQWLKDNQVDQRCCTLLATRAALRVQYNAQNWLSAQDHLTELWLWRSLIIAGVAANRPKNSMKLAVNSVRFSPPSIGFAPFSTSTAILSADYATSCAEDASGFANLAARSVSAASESAWSEYESEAVAFAFWNEVHGDLEHLAEQNSVERNQIPLWLNTDPLVPYRSMITRLRARPDPGWTFWADWYERYVKGEPQPWDLLEKIALQGTEDGDYSFWEGTDAEVNARIMEIVAAHNAKDEPASSQRNEPPRSDPAPSAVASAMAQNRKALPASFEALEGLLVLEIERLQKVNYRDDLHKDDCQEQIGTYLAMAEAVAGLRANLPEQEPTEQDAEASLPFLKDLMQRITGLPTKNIDGIEDWVRDTSTGAIQVALIVTASGIAISYGAPAIAAYATSTVVFAKNRAADFLKAFKPGSGSG